MVWAWGGLLGGKLVSSYQCINVSRIQRQLVSIYQYNKDTWRQEATILRFSSILPKAPSQPGDPHKGGRRILNRAGLYKGLGGWVVQERSLDKLISPK